MLVPKAIEVQKGQQLAKTTALAEKTVDTDVNTQTKRSLTKRNGDVQCQQIDCLQTLATELKALPMQ